MARRDAHTPSPHRAGKRANFSCSPYGPQHTANSTTTKLCLAFQPPPAVHAPESVRSTPLRAAHGIWHLDTWILTACVWHDSRSYHIPHVKKRRVRGQNRQSACTPKMLVARGLYTRVNAPCVPHPIRPPKCQSAACWQNQCVSYALAICLAAKTHLAICVLAAS